jgi:hypothetical protein
MHDPETVNVFERYPDFALDQDEADAIALGIVVDEHLAEDQDAWAQLPEEIANAAWDNDGRTVAAWNVTGPRGTYQVRLARTKIGGADVIDA